VAQVLTPVLDFQSSPMERERGLFIQEALTANQILIFFAVP
jgi:hypothetical protein